MSTENTEHTDERGYDASNIERYLLRKMRERKIARVQIRSRSGSFFCSVWRAARAIWRAARAMLKGRAFDGTARAAGRGTIRRG